MSLLILDCLKKMATLETKDEQPPEIIDIPPPIPSPGCKILYS
jgi:hypothetical protein